MLNGAGISGEVRNSIQNPLWRGKVSTVGERNSASRSCLDGLLEFPVVHHFDDRATGAHCCHHRILLLRYAVCDIENFGNARGGHEDDAAAIGNHIVARRHRNGCEIDRLIVVDLDDAVAGADWNDGPPINRKAELFAGIDIAAGPIDDNTADPFRDRGIGDDVSPAGDVRSTVVCDHENGFGAACFDGRSVEVIGRRRIDLGPCSDGHRATNDLGALPKRAHPNRRASQAKAVQRIGYGASIEFAQPIQHVSQSLYVRSAAQFTASSGVSNPIDNHGRYTKNMTVIDFRLLRHLWYFLAVAEMRHFGRAAEKLGISQPPLSQQIKILERVLGVRLFDRSQRGVALTAEGEAILPAVQRLADQAKRIESLVLEARAGRASSLAIGAITSAMLTILPDVIRTFRADFESTALTITELDTAAAVDALRARQIDIVFGRIGSPLLDISIEPIVSDQLIVAVPLEHKLAQRQKIDLVDLAGQPMILFPRRISPFYYDSIIAACFGAGFSPHILHEAASIVSQIAFVTCGLGIALVPNSISSLGSGKVVFRPLVQDVDVVTIGMAWNSDNHNPALVALIQIVRQHIELEKGLRSARPAPLFG